jgi:hypothetical protein
MKHIGSVKNVRKCNAKFDSSFARKVAEMLDEYLNSMHARLNNI